MESTSPLAVALKNVQELYAKRPNSKETQEAMATLEEMAMELFDNWQVLESDDPALAEKWNMFYAPYSETAMTGGFSSSLVELLQSIIGGSISREDGILLFKSLEDDPQAIQQAKARFDYAWQLFSQNPSLYTSECAYIMWFVQLPQFQEYLADGLETLLGRPMAEKLAGMNDQQLAEKVEADYRLAVEGYPSANIHKKLAARTFMNDLVAATSRGLGLSGISSYMQDSVTFVGGERGLHCSCYAEQLPPLIRDLLSGGGYLDFITTNEEAGIIFADLAADSAFFSPLSGFVYLENDPATPGHALRMADSLVHETAHAVYQKNHPIEEANNQVLNERHSVIHQLRFYENLLERAGVEMAINDRSGFEDALWTCAYLKITVRYFNFLLGYDYDNFDPEDVSAEWGATDAQRLLWQEESAHHPSLPFISDREEVSRVIFESHPSFSWLSLEDKVNIADVFIKYTIDGQASADDVFKIRTWLRGHGVTPFEAMHDLVGRDLEAVIGELRQRYE